VDRPPDGAVSGGRDPFNIKHFTYVMYTTSWASAARPRTFCAISGIEHALWTSPQSLRPAGLQPARGRCREKVRVYANGWATCKDPHRTAARALEILEMGFTA